MIKIYTTPTCAFCKMAKDYFKSKGLSYEEYDVSKDIPRQKEMIEKTGQFGVPVIDIDGKIVVGFDREKINEYCRNCQTSLSFSKWSCHRALRCSYLSSRHFVNAPSSFESRSSIFFIKSRNSALSNHSQGFKSTCSAC